MRKLITLVFLFLAGSSFAQQLTEKDPKREDTFISVEQMPVYPGGNDSLMLFIRKHMQYPQEAMESGVEGKVLIGFIVDKSGKVRDVSVKRSGGNPTLDAEALRVVKLLPDWQPGIQDGKPVNVSFVLPLVFRLEP